MEAKKQGHNLQGGKGANSPPQKKERLNKTLMQILVKNGKEWSSAPWLLPPPPEDCLHALPQQKLNKFVSYYFVDKVLTC